MNLSDIKVMTVDVETGGLDPWHDQLLLIGYRYNGQGKVNQIRLYNNEKSDNLFIQALANPNITKRGHNIHYDLLFLFCNGLSVGGLLDDTRIIAYLEDPEQEIGLKSLVEKRLNRKVVRMEDFGTTKIKNHSKKYLKKYENSEVDHEHLNLKRYLVKSGNLWVSEKTLEGYNIADVVNCDDLRKELRVTQWYKDVEQPLTGILFDAEKRGISLDIPYLKELDNEFQRIITESEKSLPAGVNCKSPKQVKEAFQKEGVNLDSTDKHTLKLLLWRNGVGSELCKRLLYYRQISKLHSTYVKPFLINADSSGKLHGRFNQAGRETGTYGDIKGTATGRLSSSDPNLQNIPDRTEEGKRIRKCFIATPGMLLIDSDLKQIEPRLIAHYSQSKVLLNAYEKEEDTHAIMGGLIFNKQPNALSKIERFIGKTSWLATVYGCWYKKLRQIVEINSDEPIFYDDEFYRKIQDSFWAANPEIRSWREQHIARVRNIGYIETIGGRIIKIRRDNSSGQWGEHEFERLAVNYQIQGSAADIMKMIVVHLGNEWRGQLLATIHDEILAEFFQTKTSQDIDTRVHLNAIMSHTVNLKNVPIEADTKIINTWADK